ncbi:DUF3859 domain-containing protein [Sulfurimonas sp. HSL-3221]|uniref:DUF3859 domain-containing protein n=1 Tax=Sulfurimonadaceae TaxID=2771471 RepID=UPI001E478369|nr:DUF3859 domain-containing protein [Sulfurimonas sp. HSL-3221]UFS63356.1 DUF3859 domain-containing protein [Sulfurimonas sp. HSL-3221]
MKKNILILILLTMISVINASAFNNPSGSIKSFLLVHSYLKKTGGSLYQDESRVSGLVNDDTYKIELIAPNVWTIPNKLGTGFVLGVRFYDIPQNVQSLELRVNFPEMTLPTGEKRSSIKRPIDISGHKGSYDWFFEYYFDAAYETNPGDWTIQIYSNSVLLHKSQFEVVQSNTIE